MDNSDVVINDAAMTKVIIPMLKAIIDALNSSHSKSDIKDDVIDLLSTVEKARDNLVAKKVNKNQKSASHYGSNKTPPGSHINTSV